MKKIMDKIFGRRTYDDRTIMALLDERLVALQKCQENTNTELKEFRQESSDNYVKLYVRIENLEAQRNMLTNIWKGARFSAVCAAGCVIVILFILGEMSIKEVIRFWF